MQNLRQQLTAPHNSCICHTTLSQAAKILPPPGPAPQDSKIAPLAGRRESHGRSRGWAGHRGVPTLPHRALPTWMPSWLASSAPSVLQMWPRELYRRQRTDGCRWPFPGHSQDSLGQRDSLLQRDFRAEQPRGLPQPIPALWSYRERAAIQHSAASIQSPQDTQLGSPARQAAGQAAESLCPMASIPSMAGSQRPWAGSATTGCQHRPAGAAPSTTLCPQYSTQQLPRVESTARCWEKTPGWTRAP